MEKRFLSQLNILILVLILFVAGYAIGAKVTINKVTIPTTTPSHSLANINAGGFSADSNSDGKIDEANNADWSEDSLKLNGTDSSKFERKDCFYLKDPSGADAKTYIWNNGNAHKVVVNISSGVCSNGIYNSKCSIILSTSNTAGLTNIAIAEYYQNGGLGTWGAIVGGKIRNSNAVSADSGDNGDGTQDVIMRDTQSTARIYLYDDSTSETNSLYQWTLSDSDDNWSVNWIQLCSY